MSSPRHKEAAAEFVRLLEIMAQLRAPGGCAWDREQTLASLRRYLLEESYEVLDALEREHMADLCEELGDLMLQPVFQAQITSEGQHFDMADVLTGINNKLIRRHPHVFGDAQADDAEAVKRRWDEIKQQEKSARGVTEQKALLDGVLNAQPALMEATEISKKAAGVGFDWPDVEGVLQKLAEEAQELRAAATPQEREEELGDLLFTIVNLARFWKLDPELALRQANRKFRSRFAHVEAAQRESGKAWNELELAQMEQWWQEAKRS
jgi:tetrapyrrole methylase family protein / MazG family protein